jgi:hypothetical protein
MLQILGISLIVSLFSFALSGALDTEMANVLTPILLVLQLLTINNLGYLISRRMEDDERP